MSDMTRENAIKILEFEKQGVFKSLATKEALAMAISALSENKTPMIDKSNFDTEQYKTDLQSAYDCGYNKALSENKGEWIDNGNGSYTCSNCKTEWTTSQIEKMRFCPTCGADMREPKGEKGTE